MIDRLLSEEVQNFIKDHQFDDPFLLSLHTKKGSDFPLREAIEQIQSLQKAKNKLPSWVGEKGIIWPAPISVEQSSSELTARYKESQLQGQSIVDLTGGMGVDASFFAEGFKKVSYVEPNEVLCKLASHNFKMLHKDIEVLNLTAEAFLKENSERFDVIFIDPSRRSGQKKVFKITDSAPNLYEIVPECLRRSDQVLIKLSPLVDLSLLIRDFEPSMIWVVAVKGEVKEVLCSIDKQKRPVNIRAVDLSNDMRSIDFNFEWDEEAKAVNKYSLPLQYIYEPNAVILKTGAFKLIGERFDLLKLHQHSHLYTSDKYVNDFPGKTLKILSTINQNKKDIKRAIPNGKVNVIARNYPLTATQIKKKFGLTDAGEQFLIGTTLQGSKKVLLLCERL